MRSPRVPVVLLLAFALAGLLGACGTSGADDADSRGTKTTNDKKSTTTSSKAPITVARSAEAQRYATALITKLKEDGSGVFDTSQASCMAGSYLDAIGVEALKAAGISPAAFAEGNGRDFNDKITLTEAMGNQVFDGFARCGVDVAKVFRLMYTSENPTPEENACLDSLLTESNLRRSFMADYLGQKLDPDPIDQLEACATAS